MHFYHLFNNNLFFKNSKVTCQDVFSFLNFSTNSCTDLCKLAYIKSAAENLSPAQRYVFETSFTKTFTQYWGDSGLLLVDVKTKDIHLYFFYQS